MVQSKSNNTIQALWVGIGSFCSFGFSLVSAAIISRYLTKNDYGTYKQVMYVYNTLLIVFTLGLPRAYSYFLPRVDINQGRNVIKKLNLCFFVLGVVFSSLLYFGADVISNLLKNPSLTIPIKMFSPTPIFLLPTMGIEGILATYKKTQWNALFAIVTRLLSVIFVALPVMYYKADCETAVFGFTLSSIFTCAVGLYIMYLPFRGVADEKTSLTYKEIFSFSLPLMFAGFWGIAEKSADQFFISRWFGEAVFADFANGSLELPFVGMVLSAGAVVLLPLFSKMLVDKSTYGEVIDLWRRSALKAAFILYPLVVFAWFYADEIMMFLYGSKYEDSGSYFRIMLTINFFTIAQYYPILLALGKTKLYSNVLMISAIAVWLLEYLSVCIFANPYLVSVVAILIRITKIFIFLNVIADMFGCGFTNLFPWKKISKVLLSSIVSGFCSYIILIYLLKIDYKLLTISVGFIIFLLLEFVLDKVFSIGYMQIVQPIIYKLSKRYVTENQK